MVDYQIDELQKGIPILEDTKHFTTYLVNLSESLINDKIGVYTYISLGFIIDIRLNPVVRVFDLLQSNLIFH